jgi:serine/threonine kinase 32
VVTWHCAIRAFVWKGRVYCTHFYICIYIRLTIYKKRPFRAKTNDALQHAILNDPVPIPENHKISAHAIDFIKGLLTRDIQKRLGVGEQGFRRLQSHPWLKSITWDQLETKQAIPPFVPDVSRLLFRIYYNNIISSLCLE